MENRPQGREKHIVGQGKDLRRRGDGLGFGPAGRSDGYSGRTGAYQGSPARSGGRASGGGKSLIGIIIAAVVLLLGGGGVGLSGLLGGGSLSDDTGGYTQHNTQPQAGASGSQSASGGMSLSLSELLGGLGGSSSGWETAQNTGALNTSVAAGARDKRTVLRGGGQDTVTLMVYMCGTDLESKYGMGTADLQEMLSARLSDKVNLLVYTGGCRQWKNSTVSSAVNQIYQVKNGSLNLLEPNLGSAAMTDPDTLSGFIRWCAQRCPANRMGLIFWDHGGGSLSGYGYDEKFSAAGSMGLAGIGRALKNGGVTFDFIGFDACLMATLENALLLSDYADYLIASEETEPGVGWYYTNWLTALSENTSMPTAELGKRIADDFVSVCNQKCPGQDTTLSVVDLAELTCTVPEALRAFSADTSALVQSDYRAVASARSGTREFAASSRIDQVDLVHFATKLNTAEGRALSQALLGAVKYNRTSSTVSNAYGLSIYFPYQKTGKVPSAVAAYDDIGMDSEYARCIEQFAALEAGGQAAAGGAASPLPSLLGGGTGSSPLGADMISSLLGGLLGGSLGGRSVDLDTAAAYLAQHRFDASALVWAGSTPSITLPEEQWRLVNDLELNVFLDDGSGWIDLGLDNVFSFDERGALLGEFDGTWLAIDRPAPLRTATATRSPAMSPVC